MSGACTGKFTNKKVPYCVKFNPDEDKQHLFVVGCSDKKIYTVSYSWQVYTVKNGLLL